MKIGLRVKFAAFFLIFGCGLVAALSALISNFTETSFMNRYADNLLRLIQVAEGVLDLTPEEIRRYGETGQEDERYRELQDMLNEIKTASQVEYLYLMYSTGPDSAIYLFDAATPEDDPNTLGVLGEEVLDYQYDYQKNLRNTFETGKETKNLDVTTSEEMGHLASAYVPILDESGKAIAVLGADESMDEILKEIEVQQMSIVKKVAIGTGCSLLVLLLIVQWSVIRPVRKLKHGVERLAEGELGVTVDVRSRDEIDEISRIFNRMSRNIEGHIREVEDLNQGYDRFVPSKLFHLLRRSSVVDVRLGDQVNTEIAVAAMQIDGFGELSRRLPAGRLFAFINHVLSECIPPVMENGGVIERFEKAGLQAFYTESVKEALTAAVTVRQKILAASKADTLGAGKKVDITIGITYGPVMVGVVGQDRRMDNITISEQTVIAEYLQRIGPKYFSGILVTGAAAQAVPGFEDNYHSRFLGFLRVEALNRAERIYDVFDGDEEEIRHQKMVTKRTFEKGVRLYSAGFYSDARRAFIEVLKQFRKDGAAREYLYLCNQKDKDEPEEGKICYLEVL